MNWFHCTRFTGLDSLDLIHCVGFIEFTLFTSKSTKTQSLRGGTVKSLYQRLLRAAIRLSDLVIVGRCVWPRYNNAINQQV